LFTTPESVAYGLFGSLTAPLVNRAAIKAAFNRANAMQLAALYNYQKAIVNGFVEVYNEMLRIKNLQQVFELKTE
jgi:outer membrane protein TolC